MERRGARAWVARYSGCPLLPVPHTHAHWREHTAQEGLAEIAAQMLRSAHFHLKVVKENNPTLPVSVRASERDYHLIRVHL